MSEQRKIKVTYARVATRDSCRETRRSSSQTRTFILLLNDQHLVHIVVRTIFYLFIFIFLFHLPTHRRPPLFSSDLETRVSSHRVDTNFALALSRRNIDILYVNFYTLYFFYVRITLVPKSNVCTLYTLCTICTLQIAIQSSAIIIR